MIRRRAGFTIIELLVVVSVVGILASVALPKFRDVQRRARATQLLGDFDVLRHAALSFYVDSGYFPPEAGRAAVPRNLRRYLPAGFIMAKPHWTMDYENWQLQKRLRFMKTGVAVGVSFTTASDQALGATAMRLAGNRPGYTMGRKYTFLISGF